MTVNTHLTMGTSERLGCASTCCFSGWLALYAKHNDWRKLWRLKRCQGFSPKACCAHLMQWLMSWRSDWFPLQSI